MEYLLQHLKTKLWLQIFVAMVLGAAAGLLIGEPIAVVKPIGTIFIRLIKMLIVPLVFCSIVAAICSMDDLAALGRKGIKSLVLYLLTTAVAITIGLAVGKITNIGGGAELDSLTELDTVQEVQETSLVDTLVNIVPSNPVEAFAEGNILQIIVFAVFLGCAIHMASDKGKPLSHFITSSAEVMYKMTNIIMRFAPFGVFALVAWITGTQDSKLLVELLHVIVAVYFACVVHMIVTYGGLLALFARLKPIYFFSKIIPVQLLGFTTTSSAATLPVTMEVSKNKLGVSNATASFTLPLGTTINMDGTAIYQGICVMFVAQGLGIELSMADYMTVILTSTLASIGTAGVPGAGLIMLTLVLAAVGLPLEAIALIAGIDRILDMARTAVNVTGDAAVAVLVDKSEGSFDKEIYENKNA